MRESEVACLKSHQSAWQIVTKHKEPVLILEDDALLSNKTPKLLIALTQTQSIDHVTLEVRSRKKLLAKSAIALSPSMNLVRLYQDRTGAAAYVLWPKGAEILLERSRHAAGLAHAVPLAATEGRHILG